MDGARSRTPNRHHRRSPSRRSMPTARPHFQTRPSCCSRSAAWVWLALGSEHRQRRRSSRRSDPQAFARLPIPMLHNTNTIGGQPRQLGNPASPRLQAHGTCQPAWLVRRRICTVWAGALAIAKMRRRCPSTVVSAVQAVGAAHGCGRPLCACRQACWQPTALRRRSSSPAMRRRTAPIRCLGSCAIGPHGLCGGGERTHARTRAARLMHSGSDGRWSLCVACLRVDRARPGLRTSRRLWLIRTCTYARAPSLPPSCIRVSRRRH